MPAAKKIDYEQIEAGWRAGIKSPHQLAREYTEDTGVAVSHAAIIKHFKRLGVPRDLAARVKAKADRMVTEAMVTGKVTPVTTKTDSEVVEAGAIEVATIRVSHRKDIRRSKSLLIDLMAELEHETSKLDLFEELGDLLRNEDDKGRDKLNDLYKKVISSASRVDSMKKLAETLRVLVAMEREAYGITGGDIEPKDIPAGLAHFYGA